MEVKVVFTGCVYIEGNTLEEIREKWDELPLYSADALEDYGAEVMSTDTCTLTDVNKETGLITLKEVVL